MNWKKGLPQVVKFGKTGRDANGFNEPAGLACDAFGNVIINDAGNLAIKVIESIFYPLAMNEHIVNLHLPFLGFWQELQFRRTCETQ